MGKETNSHDFRRWGLNIYTVSMIVGIIRTMRNIKTKFKGKLSKQFNKIQV